MPVLTSFFTRRHLRRPQLWAPTTRELGCYAIILAASPARKTSGTEITPTGGAAEPANRPIAYSAKTVL
jgi:hypothetical protein